MTTTYGIYAPALYGRHHDSDTDAARAACLGRSLLPATDHGSAVQAATAGARPWGGVVTLAAKAALTGAASNEKGADP